MTTSFLLGGVGDILAQRLAFRMSSEGVVDGNHFSINWARTARMGVIEYIIM